GDGLARAAERSRRPGRASGALSSEPRTRARLRPRRHPPCADALHLEKDRRAGRRRLRRDGAACTRAQDFHDSGNRGHTMTTLKDKLVIVTGGARGLGAALCERLAQEGSKVVCVDLKLELAQETCARIRDKHRDAVNWACPADIGDAQQVETLVREVTERYGPIDIVINNAGVDITLSIDELAVDDFDRVVQTNLRGPFLLSKYVAPHMRERGGGHIVNIASTAAKRAWPNASAYHASKWGLLGLSHALHAELRPQGIKVTAVVAG